MKQYTRRGLISLLGVLALMSCQRFHGQNLFQLGPTDSVITESVKAALTDDDERFANVIHVESSKGIVFLSGYVKTIRQSDTAEAIARQVKGVKQVENNIIVRK